MPYVSDVFNLISVHDQALFWDATILWIVVLSIEVIDPPSSPTFSVNRPRVYWTSPLPHKGVPLPRVTYCLFVFHRCNENPKLRSEKETKRDILQIWIGPEIGEGERKGRRRVRMKGKRLKHMTSSSDTFFSSESMLLAIIYKSNSYFDSTMITSESSSSSVGWVLFEYAINFIDCYKNSSNITLLINNSP